MLLKNYLIKLINAPEKDIYSSQTLYECLFFLIETESYNDAFVLADLIVDSQLDDGGFDIGYDFLFGKGLTKTYDKEGTTPEILSITALSLLVHKCKGFLTKEQFKRYQAAIVKGVNWLLENQLTIETNKSAIPYAPHSFEYVHITNATSFAISAIALSYSLVNDGLKNDLQELYGKLNKFMLDELVGTSYTAKFWPYFYQNGSEFEKQYINDKVDNYHIAQQLYFHIIADEFLPCSHNKLIINSVSEYLYSCIDDGGFIPYTIRSGKATSKVDVWGYSSVIMALAKASKYLDKPQYMIAALSANNYLFKYCKASDYFLPIVDNNTRKPFDINFYPRSDAWVIHSVSVLNNLSDISQSHIEFCRLVYDKIKSNKFRGLENHTYSLRKKFFVKLLRLVKR